MLHYARADTHFLPHVFYQLVHVLQTSPQIEPLSLIKVVLGKSGVTASQAFTWTCYEPTSGYGPMGWRGLLQKYSKNDAYNVPVLPHSYTVPDTSKTSLEFHLMRALHDWRDQVARDEDESPRAILSHHALFKLAEKGPQTVAGVLSLITPTSKFVLQRREELALYIKAKKEEWEDSSGAVANERVDSSVARSNGDVGVLQELNVKPSKQLWSDSSMLHLSLILGTPLIRL